MRYPVTANEISVTQSQLALFVMAADQRQDVSTVSCSEDKIITTEAVHIVAANRVISEPAGYHERMTPRRRESGFFPDECFFAPANKPGGMPGFCLHHDRN
jgi:hypothetical protein